MKRLILAATAVVSLFANQAAAETVISYFGLSPEQIIYLLEENEKCITVVSSTLKENGEIEPYSIAVTAIDQCKETIASIQKEMLANK